MTTGRAAWYAGPSMASRRSAGGVARPRRAAGGSGGPELRVPDPPDRFVGRRAEIDALAARVEAGARVLTLLGPPGTGKTRLSIALARESATRGLVEGAIFVDLSAATSLDDVVRDVANAIDLRLGGNVDAQAGAARIGEALAARGRTLLVLDNFEQITVHAIATVAPWSAKASALTVVVTSREVMRVRGEEVVEIPPLSVPAEGAAGAAIAATDAVLLLLARAPGYVPQGDDELVAIAEIARRLEGIPLALELAASRLALMGAIELRDRLAEGSLETGRLSGLDVLAHGRRDAPARQATLRGAIDWSWDLLSDEERRALTCLALHRGTFSVDAAVATIAREPKEERVALEILQSLREKSLVARAGQGRVRLLESVREYGLEKLEDREAGLRMARFFGREGTKRLGELRGRHARAALAWLAAERESMLAAHDSIATRDDAEAVALRVDLLLALDAVIARLGPGGAHLGRLDAVIASPALASDATRSTRVLVARARVLRDRGEMDACVRDLESARDRLSGGAVRVELGEAWLAQGRFEDATSELELALSEARRDHDRRAEQRAHAALGLVHHGRGKLDVAQEHYALALDLAISLGDAHAEAQARRDLGNLCLMRGEHDRARAHYEEALARSPGDDLRLEGLVRGNLAILDQEQGHLDEAHAHLERALACLRTVGDRPFEAHLLGYLGAVHHERGQLVAARAAYSRALEVLSEVRDVRLEGVFLAARAAALASSGRAGAAQNDLELAERRLREVGDPALIATLDLHRAQVAIAAAAERGARGESEAAIARARDAITAAEAFSAQSDDVRFAMRMLRRALPADELEIAEGAAWFRVPGREVVDLGSRPTMARVLDALASARLRAPGEPVGIDELVAAGWPGEKVMPLAAQNRVRVAVTTLRNLGLRGVVVFKEGGHLLDASVPLRRVPA
ncbi:Hypothetical protein I5071_75510 [Sandaracinus amylolyticus]|nr:Hypothetical protein I5071_75510 [Sandaracinus amylolyticus]